jgi:hypothetical protein
MLNAFHVQVAQMQQWLPATAPYHAGCIAAWQRDAV